MSGRSRRREKVGRATFAEKTHMIWRTLTPRPFWPPRCLLGASWVPPGCLWVSPGCLLGVSRCFQMPPDASRSFQMLPDASRCFSDASRCLPDASTRFWSHLVEIWSKKQSLRIDLPGGQNVPTLHESLLHPLIRSHLPSGAKIQFVVD